MHHTDEEHPTQGGHDLRDPETTTEQETADTNVWSPRQEPETEEPATGPETGTETGEPLLNR